MHTEGDSEYQYLRLSILEEYHRLIQEKIKPLSQQAEAALRISDYNELNLIESKKGAVFDLIFLQKLRKEEIVSWLELDSLLRKVGTTYPDEHEKMYG